MGQMSATRALQLGGRVALRLLGFVLVTLLLFAIIEGLCSAALIIADLRRGHASRKNDNSMYLRYDRELGWVDAPNLDLKDIWGPGMSLRTNEQGFRNETTISPEVPPGKIRVVCSGDSFTFGYGVGDNDTWCALLSNFDERLQTVNTGIVGYGIDQAFLLYKRASNTLQHNIQLFAFIGDDLSRIETDNYFWIGKPILSLRDGQLVEGNVPVPLHLIRSKIAAWGRMYGDVLRPIRTVEFLSRASDHFHLARAAGSRPSETQEQWNNVIGTILASLKGLNESKHSTLVLVCLPTESDRQIDTSQYGRSVVHDEAAKQGILLIDLIDDFQKLHFDQVPRLFIRDENAIYRGEEGHFTVEGNRYIAQEIYSHLVQLGVLQDAKRNPHRVSRAN
jgi:hypothetical protein